MLSIALRLVVMVTTIAVLVWFVDIQAAWEAIREMNYAWLIPAVVCYAAAKLAAGVRWRMIIARLVDMRAQDAVAIAHVSYLANAFLPAQVGHLVGIQLTARRSKANRVALTGGVFAVMPLTDAVVFMTLGLLAIMFVDVPLRGTFIAIAMGIAITVIIVAVWVARWERQQGWGSRQPMLKLLPPRVRVWIEQYAEHFIDGLSAFRDVKIAAATIGLAFAMWLLVTAALLLVGLGLGIELSIPEWITITIISQIVILLPVTPSSVGAYNVSVTALAAGFGASSGAAFSLAIIAQVTMIGYLIIAGAAALFYLRITPGDAFSLGSGRDKPGEDERSRRPAAHRSRREAER